MDKLIVKNFGPLKNINIELKRVNLFIGKNGSGKSVLAKVITIVLDTFNNRLDEKSFNQKFNDYNIDYINTETIIKLTSGNELLFELNKKKSHLPFANEIIDMHDKSIKLESVNKENQILYEELLEKLNILKDETFSDKEDLEIKIHKELKEINENHLQTLSTIKDITRLSSQYIPAERNLISLFSQSLSSLVASDIPLPKFLLQFSSEYEKARKEIKILKLLNVKYQFKEGKEYIIYGETEDSILLEHSSSGIQSALPLYLTTKYFASKHRDIIVEEPEQNLFPKAQYETILHLVSHIADKNELFMMTHSPYVLSSLNNLLFAYKVSQIGNKAHNKIKELLDEKYWINPDTFSAYYLDDGKARNIVSKRGLISDNEIDEISEDIAGKFDEMLEIYREFRNEK